MSSSSANPAPEKPFFRRIWDGWMKFNHILGDIIAKFWLTLLYFTLLLPFGLWTRLAVDPLDLRPKSASTYWHPHTESSSNTISQGGE